MATLLLFTFFDNPADSFDDQPLELSVQPVQDIALAGIQVDQEHFLYIGIISPDAHAQPTG